jgi:hypothetical protein
MEFYQLGNEIGEYQRTDDGWSAGNVQRGDDCNFFVINV